jgi:hypothetical protein
MKRRHGLLLLLAFTAAAWPKTSEAVASLSCRSASGLVCGAKGCERLDLYENLTVSFERKQISYCAGEGCYAARVVMVKAEDGGVSFAFEAKPEGRPGGRVDRLATIHPGGTAATVGIFLADGTVQFSRMECGGPP